MLLVTPGVSAVTTVEGTLDIDSTTPLDNYRLTAHAINEMQVRQGVGANQDVTVPKTFLATLKRNAQFTLHVQVSFDDGAHWVDFPEYHPVLRA